MAPDFISAGSSLRRSGFFLAMGALLAAASSTTAHAAPSVFGESAMVKVRPAYPARADTGVGVTGARNEFVSFQVVVHGGESGVKGVRAELASLTSAEDTLPPSAITLFRESNLNITESSGGMGEKGQWPDALVPSRDEVLGEARKAFPFDVAAKEAHAIWVDVQIPDDAAPGVYHGEVHVTGEGGLDARVPVTLTVVDAALPSTASLRSAFLIFPGNVCVAHTGASDCGSEATQTELLARYQRIALDHRLTLTNFFFLPQNGDWKAFDGKYQPFMEGNAATRLRGAKMTSAQFTGARTASRLQAFAQHFADRGWMDRAFDYTGDEPPYGISFAEAKSRAELVRTSAPLLRTLVTTTYAAAKTNGLDAFVDILAPVVNHLDGATPDYDATKQRPGYEAFLQENARKDKWVYQSCMSQGCAYGTNMPENGANVGWPSYMVDRSAAKNRAMQWVAFTQQAGGELYYETALTLPTAWTDQFRFNGNGDGTLFYPGTPERIGGKSQVPVASIRLKLIRQGMQDYEWLKLVSDAGDPAFAQQVAQTVVPAAYRVGDDGAAFDRARLQLITRYLELTGKSFPDPTAQGAALLAKANGQKLDPVTGLPSGAGGLSDDFGSGGGVEGATCSTTKDALGTSAVVLALLVMAAWTSHASRRSKVKVTLPVRDWRRPR